jgi:hypothetical protein
MTSLCHLLVEVGPGSIHPYLRLFDNYPFAKSLQYILGRAMQLGCICHPLTSLTDSGNQCCLSAKMSVRDALSDRVIVVLAPDGQES